MSLHILSAFNPFHIPPKKYKRVLEGKISKISMREAVNVFLKLWVQLSMVKFAVNY